MAGFTITISADNDPDAGTRIHVDIAAGGARVTELTMRPAEGGTLSATQLAMVNLDALISALAPAAATAAGPPPNAAAGQPEATADAPRAEPSPPSPSSSVSAYSPVSLGRSPQPGTAAGRATTPLPTTGHTTGPAKLPSPRRGTAATSVAGQRSTGQRSGGRRAYRRMPDPDTVLDAYRQVDGTTALARHFGVPRHTASGWLRRLRTMGLLDS